MNELKCKTCDACSFEEFNGRPNRYYCEEARTIDRPCRLICKTKRHSRDFTVKRTPKWCPRKGK